MKNSGKLDDKDDTKLSQDEIIEKLRKQLEEQKTLTHGLQFLKKNIYIFLFSKKKNVCNVFNFSSLTTPRFCFCKYLKIGWQERARYAERKLRRVTKQVYFVSVFLQVFSKEKKFWVTFSIIFLKKHCFSSILLPFDCLKMYY